MGKILVITSSGNDWKTPCRLFQRHGHEVVLWHDKESPPRYPSPNIEPQVAVVLRHDTTDGYVEGLRQSLPDTHFVFPYRESRPYVFAPLNNPGQSWHIGMKLDWNVVLFLVDRILNVRQLRAGQNGKGYSLPVGSSREQRMR